jgi:uncharacterized membrane protein YGL010W
MNCRTIFLKHTWTTLKLMMLMKTIKQWLTEYGSIYHETMSNLINQISIPLIFFCIIGFFFSLKLPFLKLGDIEANVALFAILFLNAYYFILSKPLAAGIFLFSLTCCLICYLIEQLHFVPLIQFCITVFVLAGVGQLLEKGTSTKKLSLLRYLHYLMITPALLMSFIYERLGISH